MFLNLRRPLRSALALAAVATCSVALAQDNPPPSDPAPTTQAAPQTNSVPDAQVEANVLKALAAVPELQNQPITTNTVYGTVTLTGSVQNEAQRTQAENLVARTVGVKKVVDELTVGSVPAASSQPSGSQLPTAQQPDQVSAGPDSDNTGQTAPPADAQQSYPQQQDGQYAQPAAGQYPQQGYPQQPSYPQQYPQQNGSGYPPQGPNGYPQQNPGYPQGPNAYPQQAPGYPQQGPSGYPQPNPGYPQQGSNGYPQQNPYNQQPGYPQQGSSPYSQPGYNQPYPPSGQPSAQSYSANQPPVFGGQQGGEMVTVPSGALLRIRVNQTLDSSRTKPGATFDGVVVNDLVADGAIAIPRGATVQGTVVDAKKSGALTGRGELSLQLTQITLGGKVYPLVSDLWDHHGGDKTIQTANSTAVGTGMGAVVGALAGGGAGAAVGAGVGAALGLGSSAASHASQVYIPSEGLLTFHLAQPLSVATLSQQEMDRLSQGVPNGGAQPMRRRVYSPYPYGPYYRPYPYPY